MCQYESNDLRYCVQADSRRRADVASGPTARDEPGDERPIDTRPWIAAVSTRYPAGVELCRTPRQYYHVLRRSRGEICARLPGPPPAVLRCEDGEWYCYEQRAGRAPAVGQLDREAVLTRLRGARPILVTDSEEADLLAAGAVRRRRTSNPDTGRSPEQRRAAPTGGAAEGRR